MFHRDLVAKQVLRLCNPVGWESTTRWPLVAAPLGQGTFRPHCPPFLGLVLSVSALNHTVRVSRAAARPGAGIIGLRILMIALGGEWVTRFHF